MADFVLKFKEPSTYEDRSRSSHKLNFYIAIGLFILVAIISDWIYGLIIAIVFFAIQYYKSSRWDKFFITEIRVDNEQLTISYKEKNQWKEVTGNKNDFKLKKEIAFNTTRTAYLAVYYKKDLLIKQFEIGEWDENLFNRVITAI